eukprot:tig00020610_g12076.t1
MSWDWAGRFLYGANEDLGLACGQLQDGTPVALAQLPYVLSISGTCGFGELLAYLRSEDTHIGFTLTLHFVPSDSSLADVFVHRLEAKEEAAAVELLTGEKLYLVPTPLLAAEIPFLGDELQRRPAHHRPHLIAVAAARKAGRSVARPATPPPPHAGHVRPEDAYGDYAYEDTAAEAEAAAREQTYAKPAGLQAASPLGTPLEGPGEGEGDGDGEGDGEYMEGFEEGTCSPAYALGESAGDDVDGPHTPSPPPMPFARPAVVIPESVAKPRPLPRAPHPAFRSPSPARERERRPSSPPPPPERKLSSGPAPGSDAPVHVTGTVTFRHSAGRFAFVECDKDSPRPAPRFVFVPGPVVSRFRLSVGDRVEGEASRRARDDKGYPLLQFVREPEPQPEPREQPRALRKALAQPAALCLAAPPGPRPIAPAARSRSPPLRRREGGPPPARARPGPRSPPPPRRAHSPIDSR